MKVNPNWLTSINSLQFFQTSRFLNRIVYIICYFNVSIRAACVLALLFRADRRDNTNVVTARTLNASNEPMNDDIMVLIIL